MGGTVSAPAEAEPVRDAKPDPQPAPGAPLADAKECKLCTKRSGELKGVFAQAKAAKARPAKPQCPPDVEELGRASWTFLHTLAATFPKEPSDEERLRMGAFLNLFSTLYPCDGCRLGLQEEILADPPELENRHTLTQWMCRLHNRKNEELGKPVFDCSLTDKRWDHDARDDC